MDRRSVLMLGAVALTGAAARAEVMKADGSISTDSTETIRLWPGTPPGGKGVHLKARIIERSADPAVINDRYVDSIGTPTLTVFRPDKPDGSALVVAPGGGYVRIVLDKEGNESGRRFNASGVTVFVLHYRLPGEGWQQPADVPLQDGQRAVRLVRSKAKEYGIDPARVGILGFSAGGHLAATLITRWNETVYAPVDAADQLEARPDFAGLMYPAIAMGGSRLLGADATPERIAAAALDKHVTAQTPPTFICLAADDDVVPPEANGIAMAAALRAAKVPSELHVFQEGGHGFCIRLTKGKPCAAWPELFLHWGNRGGWFRDPAASL
jgi:acetyl esterase/lipase